MPNICVALNNIEKLLKNRPNLLPTLLLNIRLEIIFFLEGEIVKKKKVANIIAFCTGFEGGFWPELIYAGRKIHVTGNVGTDGDGL